MALNHSLNAMSKISGETPMKLEIFNEITYEFFNEITYEITY